MSNGISKTLAVKKESVFGTAAGASGAQYQRRESSEINLVSQDIENNEIATHEQITDVGQGGRRVEGSMNCHLSGGTYQMQYEALLRRLATAVSNITALTLTTDDTPVYTITRATGSFITDGLRLWMVFSVTAGLNAGGLNRRLLVVGLTALEITYVDLDGLGALANETSVGSCTIAIPGKLTYAPSTGHTNDSFTIEELHTDLTHSYLNTGCKFSNAAHNFVPDDKATVNFGIMGRRQQFDKVAAYFTTPTAETTSPMLVPVYGRIIVDGVANANFSALSFDINGTMQTTAAIGSEFPPEISKGRINITGSLSAYYLDEIFTEAYNARAEMAVQVICTESNSPGAHFVSMVMPCLKPTNATRDDGEKSLIQTVPFRCKRLPAATGYLETSMIVQDSRFV